MNQARLPGVPTDMPTSVYTEWACGGIVKARALAMAVLTRRSDSEPMASNARLFELALAVLEATGGK